MLEKLISGGQTGADRAGLEAAKRLGIPTGGTAPKGWRVCLPDGSEASDPTLAEFGLTEHPSREYASRTRQNVVDSDGTVWFGSLDSSGARTTFDAIADYNKPSITNPSPLALRQWLQREGIKVLNVAGNRQSVNPGLFETTYAALLEALGGDRT